MKKLRFTVGFALLAFTIVMLTSSIPSSVSHSHLINQLYVFGDSLSAIGTAFRSTEKLSPPPNPPYYQGRYSNGPVWVEHLAAKLALSNAQITNVARGGATTGAGSVNGVPGLLAQVETFTSKHSQTNPKALYVLWAGANDYLSGAANPSVSVGNVSKTIVSLIKAGAQIILVGNLPDLGKLPATRNSSYASALSSLTIAHNQGLAQALESLRQQFAGVQLVELDAYTLYQEAITDPTAFGFTNVTGSCVESATLCSNPNEFLFWDGIHPTTLAHRHLGEHALTALTVASSLKPPNTSSRST